ncbi:hypothetical protein G6F68_020223 [Rhizopus microsporus]|nr:hypothetical protein G6F68_020223 [Rhizopus microsporus]
MAPSANAINVRVQPREGQAGGQRGGQARRLFGGGRQAVVLRSECRTQAARGVDEQEQGAAIAHGGFQPGQGVDGQSEPGHAGGDQDRVRHRAGQTEIGRAAWWDRG